MKKLTFVTLVAICVSGFATQSGLAQNEFRDLVKLVPSSANTLVLLNVEKALSSPLGVQEGWELKKDSAFESGLTILPTNSTHFVLASDIDLEFMEPKWEIAVTKMKDAPQTRQIAQRHGSHVDNIQGKPSVPLSSDAYVVKFSLDTYGAIAPANRQTTSNWIRQTNTKREPTVTPYLLEAIGYSDRVGSEVIMAIDLHDLLSPHMLQQKLKTAETFTLRDVDYEALAQLLAGIRGVTLGVVIDKQLSGRIKVDFTEDVSSMADFAKPLFLEALGNIGAMVDDFQSWEVKVSGRQVSLAGQLSETGMRQVMSVVDARTSMFVSSTQSSQAGEVKENSVLEATLRYFNSVNILLKDLEKLKPKTKTWGQKAMWYDKYARKIEGLPMLNVDQDMLDYGQYVAFAIRDASAALKGIGANSRYREINSPTYATYGSDRIMSWRSYGFNANYQSNVTRTAESLAAQARDSARIRGQERIKGTASANQIMTEVEKTTANVRRMMTQRYQVEF